MNISCMVKPKTKEFHSYFLVGISSHFWMAETSSESLICVHNRREYRRVKGLLSKIYYLFVPYGWSGRAVLKNDKLKHNSHLFVHSRFFIFLYISWVEKICFLFDTKKWTILGGIYSCELTYIAKDKCDGPQLPFNAQITVTKYMFHCERRERKFSYSLIPWTI